MGRVLEKDWGWKGGHEGRCGGEGKLNKRCTKVYANLKLVHLV